MRIAVATAVMAGLLAGSGPASAGEDDRSLSLSLSYATFAIPDYSPHGTVVGVDYERGLSEALAVRISGGGGAYYADSSPSFTGHMVVGMTYLFDVLKYVPYINGGVGGIVIAGSDIDTQVAPLVEVGLGLEFLHSRSFSYGAILRFESQLKETHFFTGGLRITWRWGFF